MRDLPRILLEAIMYDRWYERTRLDGIVIMLRTYYSTLSSVNLDHKAAEMKDENGELPLLGVAL